jgi:P27 family predicted phage terminase small subunit
MTRVDVDEFAKYCQFQADYIDATEWLQKNGTCYPMYDYLVDENGKRVKVFRYLMQAPQVAIARNAAAMASRIGAKFGLTPSDRSSLHVKPKQINEGGLQGFLNRGKGFNTG